MAGKWKKHQVGALIESGALVVGDGYRAKNSELSSSGLPFARAGNINAGFLFDDADCFPETNVHLVGNKVSQPGDVVFTSKGTVGRFGFVRPETPRFVYSPQLCFWRSVDRELIDPRFLSFWMSGREFFIQFKEVAGHDWPANVWMGVSVETRKYLFRLDHLRRTPARVKFISFEPLLETLGQISLAGIDWAIVGGESGPGARAMDKAWVVEIREQCLASSVPFFFKQWGGINKKKAGRLLDGRTWDGLPKVLVPSPKKIAQRSLGIRRAGDRQAANR